MENAIIQMINSNKYLSYCYRCCHLISEQKTPDILVGEERQKEFEVRGMGAPSQRKGYGVL